jgi:membrane associated rhomboid family serine protease
MLIPLRHESMQGRRWPVITFGIIALNILIFLGTHWTIDKQEPALGEVKIHLVLMAAAHPELKIQDKAQEFVNSVRTRNAPLWKEAQNPNRDVYDLWDAQHRMKDDDPDALQQEMDSLGDRYAEMSSTTLLSKYAFIPAHPTLVGLIAANFLHGGWLHLIGNMWFLWLAGAILEDTWGRLIYPAFYMIAGVLALQVHAMVNVGSFTPTIGASGAIAGLMGAFLVRFPTTKIEMGWLLFFRFYRFKMAAYWLLPLWLVTEILYGSAAQSSGVAHWAHVGGFAFGALIALAVRKSGLEQIAEKGIQEKISWVSHPLLAEASEQMEKGELDQAVASLQKLLAEKPDSIDAYRMLQRIYWQKNDLPAHRDALTKLLSLEIKANDHECAMQTCQNFRNAGGEKLPASLWLEFCRQLETQPDVSLAADEYLELAKAHPTEKQSLLAQMAAGRIYLKRLNRPEDALRLYEAAQASSIPHADWQTTIERGITEAKKVLQPQQSPVTPAV